MDKMDRSTYYDNLGWKCPACGRINRLGANFCPGCGTPAPPVQGYGGAAPEIRENTYAEPPKKGGAFKTIAIILACLLLALAIGFGVSRLILSHRDKPEGDTGEGPVTEQNDDAGTADNSGAPKAIEGGSEGSSESGGGPVVETEPPKDEGGYFVPGNTYSVVVKEGVKIRKGPGKNYDQLDRISLTDYYDQTLEGEKACLKQGARVVCVSMDGDWMEISDGWVCVRADGEDLIH